MPDIFLSHSSGDRSLVRQVKADLAALGYDVFLDLDALPAVRPDDVTESTAQALRQAMQSCSSLLYLISDQARRSRWMPWELGYFDGFRGRVFVYPVDEAAEAQARGREYLRLYPIVPLHDRAAFLARHVPRQSAGAASPDTVVSAAGSSSADVPFVLYPMPGLDRPALRAPLFDHADHEATALYGRTLEREAIASAWDPLQWSRVMGEVSTAWLRLWGMVALSQRPGAEEGHWPPAPERPDGKK